MSSRGFSLIEATIAMGILAVISSAVILMTLQILSLTYSTRLKNQSTVFSEQMIEQVRDDFQTNGWGKLSLKDSGSGTCYSSLWVSSACTDCTGPQITGTNFYRYVKLKTLGSSVAVSSVVTWSEKGVCNKKTQVDTYFYNY